MSTDYTADPGRKQEDWRHQCVRRNHPGVLWFVLSRGGWLEFVVADRLGHSCPPTSKTHDSSHVHDLTEDSSEDHPAVNEEVISEGSEEAGNSPLCPSVPCPEGRLRDDPLPFTSLAASCKVCHYFRHSCTRT